MAGQGFYGSRAGIGYYTDGEADVIVTTPVVSVVADTVVAILTDITVHVVAAAPIVAITGTGLSAPAPIPQGAPAYSSGLDVILTSPDGSATHIGANCEKLSTQRARKYGFESCTFELPDHLVSSWYHELQMMTDIQVIRNGITCFHGRITDPGLTVGTTDDRRKITARGYFDAFSDDETVRACYADSDPTNWRRPVKVPKHDFGVDAGDNVVAATNGATVDGLAAQAKWGQTYASDAWGDICWWLYNGIPTNRKVAGFECRWKYNGLLDPSRVITGKMPAYNLFTDPRGLSGTNPWQANKHQASEHYARWATGWTPLTPPNDTPSLGANGFTWEDDGTAGGGQGAMGYATVAGGAVATVVVTVPGTGYTAAPDVVFEGGGGSGAVATATVGSGGVTGVSVSSGGSGYGGAYGAPFVSFVPKPTTTSPDTTIGYSYWSHKMSLPADLKKAVAAGGQEIAAVFSLYGDGEGTGTDTGVLYAVDQNANYIASATLFDGFHLDWLWDFGHTENFELPPETASLELVIQWQTYNGSTIKRMLCFPMVTNGNGGYTYADGDSDGWIWTGAMNNSQSRESDLNLTQQVFSMVEWGGEFRGCPIVAQLYASDSPQRPVYILPEQSGCTWDRLDNYHGTSSVDYTAYPMSELAASALALSVFLSPANPYSMQFVAPTTGDQPDPYGLVIEDFTIYADAGMGNDGIGVTDCVKAVLARMGIPAAQQVVDDSDLNAKQLVFNDPTTWAAVLQGIDALLDWEYGFREGGVFYYLNPSDFTSDPRRVYQIPYSQAEVDLAVQLDDICNGCEVVWTDDNGIPHRVLYAQDSPFLPPNLDGSKIEKYHHVDFTKAVWMKDGATAADALALAKAYVAQHIAPQTTGTLNLSVATVLDGNGTPRDALEIQEGDHVRLTEAPPEEQDYGLLLVSRVVVDHDQLQVQLQVGQNRKKLDAMLARLNARVVRR
jgi:hypothetical protein